MRRLTGRGINRDLSLGAEHALYHKDGYWYDQLQRFPGILCDRDGYVFFPNRESYECCHDLRHPPRARGDGRPGTLTFRTEYLKSVNMFAMLASLRCSGSLKEGTVDHLYG